MGLIDDARAGSPRALARLVSLIERNDDQAQAISASVYPLSGRAATIGVTGPPGAGKSSLVNRLIGEYRRKNRRVGVVAVDPSSPFSGGAALGDRIRMLDRYDDPGVFIRSMASRGRLGGLSLATPAVMHLLDAVGFDVVIVETVGVGQEEIDVARYVDTTLLVQVPGLGDAIQAMKAGVLEIADIYVVNKADLPEAANTAKEIRSMLTLGASLRESGGWSPPVVKVSAKDGTGFDDLAGKIERHRAHLVDSGEMERRRTATARREIEDHLEQAARRAILKARQSDSNLIEHVANRKIDPQAAAERVLDQLAERQHRA
ncbi:MAG: methylmalonyl Co-A mutase-associated GTPase MeaB [Rhizobiales bacterium]|nr:methylmalonyl Co-A mutase-associated GTPase MeaB [Hyphomicrobiales bacterium]